MRTDRPTVADIGLDRRADRVPVKKRPYIETEDMFKSVEVWLRHRYATLDRYLLTPAGSDAARELLDKLRTEHR